MTRRVATGHDANGKAIFASDEEIAPAQFQMIWGGEDTPRFPDDGAAPGPLSLFPEAGGYRFAIITIPAGYDPANSPPPPPSPEMAQLPTNDVAHMDPDDPGQHWTETIDLEVVLKGELILELDDGVETVLRPGDTIIQNGTRHRWKNRGDEDAQFAVVILPAEHPGPGAPR
jgi:hypothetical protein